MSDAVLSVLVLLLALGLFVSEKVRHDLVAVIALLATLALGLVGPRDALLGFADPAVIAVASVLVVGRALELTGFAATLARAIIPTSWGFGAQLSVLLAIGATLSAFVNNIAALVITMPLAVQLARSTKRSPGAVLMPLAFATILGGMTTLIGTPANLILSTVREQELGAPLGFFAMSGVGVAVTLVGLIYLCLIGWRLLPERPSAARTLAAPWRVFELGWPAGDQTRAEMLPTLRKGGARLLAVFRDNRRLPSDTAPQAGDRMLLLTRNSQWDVAERSGLEPTSEMSGAPESVTARIAVAHGSILIGLGYHEISLRTGGEVAVIGAGPRAARLRQPLNTIRIQAGDQLYLRGSATALAAFIPRARLLELDRFDPGPIDPARATATVVVFVAAIAATVSGITSPAIAFFAAAAAVAGLRLIPPDEIYRAIDWPVIVLLGAMIPVGQAFEKSGAASLVAGGFADVLMGQPLFLTLAALCAGTLLLSIFLNNVATAIIMGPIAIGLARLVGVDPDAALLAVLIGASSDFLTPIGHHNNTLVMGPGGYRFTDYARAGALLAILTVATAAAYLSFVGG